jgi:hypothetical protein
MRSRVRLRKDARDAGRLTIRLNPFPAPPIGLGVSVSVGIRAVIHAALDIVDGARSALRRDRLRVRRRGHHRGEGHKGHQEPSGKKSSSHGVGLLGPCFPVAQGARHRGRRDSSTTAGSNRSGCDREGTPYASSPAVMGQSSWRPSAEGVILSWRPPGRAPHGVSGRVFQR